MIYYTYLCFFFVTIELGIRLWAITVQSKASTYLAETWKIKLTLTFLTVYLFFAEKSKIIIDVHQVKSCFIFRNFFLIFKDQEYSQMPKNIPTLAKFVTELPVFRTNTCDFWCERYAYAFPKRQNVLILGPK